MAKVTHQKCPKCGAPLILTPGVSDVACQYCRTVVHVEWGKKPPVEQPPPLTIYVKNPAPVLVPVLIALGLVVPLGLGAIAFFVSQFGGAASSAVQAVQAVQIAGVQLPGAVQKSLPATCGLNQEVVISGQKFEGPGPLVTGEVNCKIKIKDSTLKSDVVVLAKNLVEITIENSTLEGKEAAIKLAMNSKVFAKKNAVLRGSEAAIVAGVNSEITLDEATVESAEVAIRSDTNLKLSGNKSKITGKEHGLRASGNVTLEGKELSIKGGRAAIESQYNLKVDLRGGTIEGDEIGIFMKGANAEIRLSRAAQVKGKEVAIKGDTNVSLEIEDALVDSPETAIVAGVNPKFNLGPKARVHGGRVGMKVGVNLELEMREASVESEGIAICAPFNIEIQARNSKVSGGVEAFRFERRPNQLELTATTVTGKQSFGARGCGFSR